MVVLSRGGWGGAALLAVVSAFAPAPQTSRATDTLVLGIPGRSNSTPWVAAEGSFVAVAWGATANASGKTDVFIAVSRNAGKSFDAQVQVNRQAGEARLGGELPPRVALTRAAGSAPPGITVLWTARGDVTSVKLARSNDGGKTFDEPRMLQSREVQGDRGWPSLVLDNRGRAHAIWLDHRGLATDRGAPGAHAAHKTQAATDGAVMAQKSGLYYAGAGTKAGSERELAKGVCYCCKTALAAGPDGTLFAAWRHVYPGNRRDIAFSASRDGGRSFSPPARVSLDQWEINGCPDDGPALSVDAAGTVHIVWPTVLSSPQPEGALFYSSTRDGRTFTPRVRIPTLGSPRPTHPQIVVDSARRIVVAWDEVVDGKRVAVVRELKFQAGGQLASLPFLTLDSAGPGSYPVLAASSSGPIAVWTSRTPDASVIAVRALRGLH